MQYYIDLLMNEFGLNVFIKKPYSAAATTEKDDGPLLEV